MTVQIQRINFLIILQLATYFLIRVMNHTWLSHQLSFTGVTPDCQTCS